MEKMKNNLITLYNSMCLVETKGENTIIMGDCLKFVKMCIQECEEPEKSTPEKEEQEAIN